MLSSRSAAMDGELDGEFLERLKLPERPKGLGDRGRDFGVRSSISSPASSCRDMTADMSVSLLQRNPNAPAIYNRTRQKSFVSRAVCVSVFCLMLNLQEGTNDLEFVVTASNFSFFKFVLTQ